MRREGIKPHSYYAWTKEFMEAGRERLSRDTVRDATRQVLLPTSCGARRFIGRRPLRSVV